MKDAKFPARLHLGKAMRFIVEHGFTGYDLLKPTTLPRMRRVLR